MAKYQWEPSAEQERIIRQTIMHNWPEDEIKLALHRAKVLGLDPLAKQIYFERRKQYDGSVSTITTIAIESYRLQADRTGKYAGQEGPYWCGPDGTWHDVWIPSDGEKYPYAAKVGIRRVDFTAVLWSVCRFDAYCARRKARSGDRGPAPLKHFWEKYPDSQIAKCAEAAGLRRAFPAELANVYLPEEVDADSNGDRRAIQVYPTEPNADPNHQVPQDTGGDERPPTASAEMSGRQPRPGAESRTTGRPAQQGDSQPGANGAQRQAAGPPAASPERDAEIRRLADELELSADELGTIERQNGGDVLSILRKRVRDRRQSASDSRTDARPSRQEQRPGNRNQGTSGREEREASGDRNTGGRRESRQDGGREDGGRSRSQEGSGNGADGRRDQQNGRRAPANGQARQATLPNSATRENEPDEREMASLIIKGFNNLKMPSSERGKMHDQFPDQKALLQELRRLYKARQAGGGNTAAAQ